MSPEAIRQDYEEIHKPVALQFYPKRRRHYMEAIERVVVASVIAAILLASQFSG